jgi:drug/metabolite transporter (DMT)-like permease
LDQYHLRRPTVLPKLAVVAVVLGIVFLGEPAAAHLLVGTGIVLVGIALVQQRSPARASTP